MTALKELFPGPGALIGMVHLGGLPGTPYERLSLGEVIAQAAKDAEQLARLGFDGLIVENMGDRPYLLRQVGPEVTAAMTAACLAVRRAAEELPIGVQVLAGANREALAVAHSAGLDFIRAEGFVFSSVADEGLFDAADAGPLLRYRKQIGATGISILADLKKKHSSHSITADVSLGEMARAADFCGVDGLVVTGTSTGEATSPKDLREAAEAVDLPVFVGSGVTPEQIPALVPTARGLIVGSYIKRDGHWNAPLDLERCATLVKAAR